MFVGQRFVDDATARQADGAAGEATSPNNVGPWARRPEGVAGLALGLVIAVVLHALLPPAVKTLDVRPLDVAARVRSAQLARPGADERRIELELRLPPKDEERERERDAREDDPDAPGVVVSLPPPEKEEQPDVADYAAEHAQRTDRETRSRDQRQHAPAITRKLQDGRLGVVQPPVEPRAQPPATDPSIVSSGPAGAGRSASGDSGTDTSDGRGERLFALEIPRQAPREALRLNVDADGLLKNREALPELPGDGETARVAIGNRPADAARRAGSGGVEEQSGQGLRGGGDGTEGLPGLAELTPSTQELARLSGAPANDFLPEVEVDAETRLNAWRWKHAPFFNRISEAIRREWQPNVALAGADPTGRIYGAEDRTTILLVTIDRSGRVVEVQVEQASGVLPLDDEAVRAFREAGPFPNPPEQLFKGREHFTFAFGLHLYYDRVNIDLNWRPY